MKSTWDVVSDTVSQIQRERDVELQRPGQSHPPQPGAERGDTNSRKEKQVTLM